MIETWETSGYRVSRVYSEGASPVLVNSAHWEFETQLFEMKLASGERWSFVSGHKSQLFGINLRKLFVLFRVLLRSFCSPVLDLRESPRRHYDHTIYFSSRTGERL